MSSDVFPSANHVSSGGVSANHVSCDVFPAQVVGGNDVFPKENDVVLDENISGCDNSFSKSRFKSVEPPPVVLGNIEEEDENAPVDSVCENNLPEGVDNSPSNTLRRISKGLASAFYPWGGSPLFRRTALPPSTLDLHKKPPSSDSSYTFYQDGFQKSNPVANNSNVLANNSNVLIKIESSPDDPDTIAEETASAIIQEGLSTYNEAGLVPELPNRTYERNISSVSGYADLPEFHEGQLNVVGGTGNLGELFVWALAIF